MVKNTKGGKGSKSLSRKLVNSDNNTTNVVRIPDNDLEVFAIVTKMFGTICEVVTYDNKIYRCHIRGKFRGRSKRFSIVSVGKLVLIGFRDFEAPLFKNTDLLEIYEPNDFSSLSIQLSSFFSIYNSILSHFNTIYNHPDL